MSSNIGQNYPYSSETEDERHAAVAAAYADNDGLEAQVAEEITPLGQPHASDSGAEPKWWVWVCPACIVGRLHVAGYARERHALYTVCDDCGKTFTR